MGNSKEQWALALLGVRTDAYSSALLVSPPLLAGSGKDHFPSLQSPSLQSKAAITHVLISSRRQGMRHVCFHRPD